MILMIQITITNEEDTDVDDDEEKGEETVRGSRRKRTVMTLIL